MINSLVLLIGYFLGFGLESHVLTDILSFHESLQCYASTFCHTQLSFNINYLLSIALVHLESESSSFQTIFSSLIYIYECTKNFNIRNRIDGQSSLMTALRLRTAKESKRVTTAASLIVCLN